MAVEMELQIVASLLRRGRVLERLSTALALLGVLLGLAPLLSASASPWCTLLGAWLVILGLAQQYWALRVALDADLFQLIASQPALLAERTDAMDQALRDLGLQPPGLAARPWAARSRGALGLLKRQALVVALQVCLPLIIILASPWLPFAG